MKHLILLAIIASSSASAAMTNSAKPDNVYVYHNGGNVSYQCRSVLSYFDTTGSGSIVMQGCDVMNTDTQSWPRFPAQSIRIRMYGPAFKIPYEAQCSFVAFAMGQDRSTSMVIDCR